MIAASQGNIELLNLHKTAFLCSRKVPASVVLKCYDWAIEQREAGNCIISGFHSQLEKDVLHYLLKGKQPIIVALARGLKKRTERELQKKIDDGSLLIITPFEEQITRITKETAILRNKLMTEIADEVVIGYVDEKGSLKYLLDNSSKRISKLV